MAQARKKKVLEEIRKQRRRNTAVTITVVVVLIALIVVGIYFLSRNSGNSTGNSNFLFPCLGTEGTALHLHPWLRIWINGVNVTIPAAVGIRNPVFQNGIATGGPTSCFEPIHTHDTSGIIHVESPDTVTQYTLSDFFTIWNETYNTASVNGSNQPIVFTSTNILGYKADPTHRVLLLVDGTNSTDYGSLVLNQYDYCSAALGGSPPCSTTAPADPFPASYPYGTGHTLVIYYKAV